MKQIHSHLCIWCSFLILLPGCLIPSRYFMRKNIFIIQPIHQQKNCQTVLNQEPPIITIWIHGTRFFYHRLYQQGIPYHEGLLLAKNAFLPFRLKTIGETLHKADAIHFNSAHFYIFGWSGKLCFIEREEAAARLALEIKALIQQYNDIYNCTPHIRLIAHSHGGNVALNLALQEDNGSFTIDELILLACPVQEKTKYLAKRPMFKKIYALYSALDFVQVLDPQGIYKQRSKASALFSKRSFYHKSNLFQMKIKINRRAITHFEFTQPIFLRLLPSILTGIDLWHKDIIYTEDPNKMHKVLCVYTKTTKTETPFTAI